MFDCSLHENFAGKFLLDDASQKRTSLQAFTQFCRCIEFIILKISNHISYLLLKQSNFCLPWHQLLVPALHPLEMTQSTPLLEALHQRMHAVEATIQWWLPCSVPTCFVTVIKCMTWWHNAKSPVTTRRASVRLPRVTLCDANKNEENPGNAPGRCDTIHVGRSLAIYFIENWFGAPHHTQLVVLSVSSLLHQVLMSVGSFSCESCEIRMWSIFSTQNTSHAYLSTIGELNWNALASVVFSTHHSFKFLILLLSSSCFVLSSHGIRFLGYRFEELSLLSLANVSSSVEAILVTHTWTSVGCCRHRRGGERGRIFRCLCIDYQGHSTKYEHRLWVAAISFEVSAKNLTLWTSTVVFFFTVIHVHGRRIFNAGRKLSNQWTTDEICWPPINRIDGCNCFRAGWKPYIFEQHSTVENLLCSTPENYYTVVDRR